MREYFHYFKWLYIILGVMLLCYGIVAGGHLAASKAAGYERTNAQCKSEERVFDYGDVLTDREEDKLRELIARREKQTGCDIVLVTLQESLEGYAREIEPYADYRFMRRNSMRTTISGMISQTVTESYWLTTGIGRRMAASIHGFAPPAK